MPSVESVVGPLLPLPFAVRHASRRLGRVRGRRKVALASRNLVMAVGLLLCWPTGAGWAQEPFPYLVRDFVQQGSGHAPGRSLTRFNDAVVQGGAWYFAADDGIHGRELWRSDGTAVGTGMVRDICPGVCSGSPSWITATASGVFFAASDGEHGVEIWGSDGTGVGTRMLADIWRGPGSSTPSGFSAFGGLVLFRAATPDHGREPWRSDGTSTGTHQLADLTPGPASSDPGHAYRAGAWAVFGAGPRGSRKLYRTDGTSLGTQPIAANGLVDVRPATDDFGIGRWASLRDEVVILVAGDGSEWQAWRSDGTAAGTYPITSLPANGQPVSFEEGGGRVFFAADDGTGHALWATDGSVDGTYLVKDITSFPNSGNINYLTGTATGAFFLTWQQTTGFRALVERWH